MKHGAPGSFGAHLKSLREAAGFTQEELATIAGLSVHAVSALERGHRRRPHVDTVRALATALDLNETKRDVLLKSARPPDAQPAPRESGAGALPAPLTVLIGRDAELQALRLWLDDPVARLVTIVGPGGVGKSRLALELARSIAGSGKSRVDFVPLATVRHPSFVASAIAETLGLADTTASDLPNRARLACDDRDMLLVLDNFEHVLEAAPLVADLLGTVPALRVLVTSRAPLHVRGEREFVLGSLALAIDTDGDDHFAADLARAPAVRLFAERAGDVQPGFRVTPANAGAVFAICRRLDALPLAIELAAPWLRTLAPEDLLARLEQDALFSGAAARDLPERQRTMNATVAWSYQLLDADEQRAFRRFGVLPGAFPIEAAAEVLDGPAGTSSGTDTALRAVAGLMEKSLLLRADPSVVTTRPMFCMLETVRAYAAAELARTGERDEAAQGMVRYCRREAALAAEGLLGATQARWLDRVREDLDSYRGAMSWLIERRRAGEACEIAGGLMFFWLIRGHCLEGLQWYEQVLAAPSLGAAGETGALTGAAMMWYTQGALDRAAAALTRAADLARGAGDVARGAEVEHLLAHVEHATGSPHTARERFTRSAEAFRSLGIAWGVGSALTGLAWVAFGADDVDLTGHLLDEATSALRAAGPWFLSLVRYLRALVAVRRGDTDEAIAWIRESLSCIRELQDRFAFVYALVPFAAAVVARGDHAWAARILGARDAITERTGVRVVDRSVRELTEQVERQVRAGLGPERWAAAYAAGRKETIDGLLNEIDGARA